MPSRVRAETNAAPSLRRLGLAGRLGNASDPTKQTQAWTKSNVIPSLNEIRARLNQRGVDVTSSKWSKRGSSPTKELEEAVRELRAGAQDPDVDEDAKLSESKEDAPAGKSHSGERNATEEKANEPESDITKEAPAAPSNEENETPAPTPAPESQSSDAPSTGPALSGKEAAVAAKAGKKHPLQNTWTLYYDGQSHQKPSSSDQYESKLKCIGHFKTLESFFDTFATLHRPSQLGRNTNYHLFKNGIKPMWEDPANAKGGRWVLTLREQANSVGGRAAHEAILDRSWMWLVFGLIGEHFDENDQLTGAVCSLRTKGDRIALWLREKEPVEDVNALGERFLRLLEIHDLPNMNLKFSVNDGPKGNYMSVRNGPKPKQDPVEIDDKEPALETWLDSDITLHPQDHARYYAQHSRGKEGEI